MNHLFINLISQMLQTAAMSAHAQRIRSRHIEPLKPTNKTKYTCNLCRMIEEYWMKVSSDYIFVWAMANAPALGPSTSRAPTIYIAATASPDKTVCCVYVHSNLTFSPSLRVMTLEGQHRMFHIPLMTWMTKTPAVNVHHSSGDKRASLKRLPRDFGGAQILRQTASFI